MQSFQHLVEAVLQAATHRLETKHEPLSQDAAQVLDLRATVQADHVEIDAVAAFEIGGGEQVQHHALDIDPVGTRHDHQARRVLVVGFVTQILDPR